ncbi:serine hydrolase [Ornithinimicrobium faecis]|uniref:serine hydrolase n=1 Tax=Ornithinimicrobium faecis TaxID=2934158 RepID=UPI00211871FD|nr:serine hydrolase [Ornithinimicrobium sp. HY1745]
MRGTVAIACAAVLLTAGCSTGGDPSEEAGAGEVTQTSSGSGPDASQESLPVTAAPDDGAGATSTAAPAPPTDLGALDGPLREASQWVLDQLAPGATGPSAEEAEARFASDFLNQVPADQLEPVFATFREGAPLTLTGVEDVQEHPDGSAGTVLTLSGDDPIRLSIRVDADGLISGLLLQPGTPSDLPEVSSWDGLDGQFAVLGGTTAVYVGEVADGACETVHQTSDQPEPAPSGSVFKLIVLSAVVEAIGAGELTWDEDLTIVPELKSLPTGELQDRADGSTVPVREAAGLMISISDNTATDLLMDAVGPERLQAAVERVSDDPDRLTPLLSTRQLFQLGWNAPEVREQWAQADASEREHLVQELPEDLSALQGNPFAVNEVVWPDGVGWFLTGEEICTAHAVLQDQADTEAGQPLRDIMSANPGLPVPEGATYQGFKGGSVPGVLAYSFYVEDGEEGAGTVLSVQISHERAIMANSFTELTQSALGLLVTP